MTSTDVPRPSPRVFEFDSSTAAISVNAHPERVHALATSALSSIRTASVSEPDLIRFTSGPVPFALSSFLTASVSEPDPARFGSALVASVPSSIRTASVSEPDLVRSESGSLTLAVRMQQGALRLRPGRFVQPTPPALHVMPSDPAPVSAPSPVAAL